MPLVRFPQPTLDGDTGGDMARQKNDEDDTNNPHENEKA
jgi:hypothetical protein